MRTFGYGELSFGVEAGIFVAQLDAGVIDRSKAPPLEEFAQFVNARHRAQRRRIAAFGNDAGILVFDFDATLFDLPQDHPDRLQDIERLEAGDDHRLAIESGDEVIRSGPDHHRDVARPEKTIEPEIGAVENCLDGGDDGDVIAEH